MTRTEAATKWIGQLLAVAEAVEDFHAAYEGLDPEISITKQLELMDAQRGNLWLALERLRDAEKEYGRSAKA